MIFSVIISEKGGAERREAFERTEVNVGRVQGNDLMLPKGNVSKRHARLLFRDGRFIVTDLKSTNGTYVNGRKISQPTIVREGDKIYVGDFVLRIEAGPSSALPGLQTLQEIKKTPPPDSDIDEPISGQSIPSPAGPDKPGDDFGDSSQLSADNDAVVPGPPPLPGASIAAAKQTNNALFGPATIAPVPPVTTPTPHVSAAHTTSSVPPNPGHLTPTPPPQRHVAISSNPPGAKESAVGQTRAYRAALAQLIDRVGEAIDLGVLSADKPLDAAMATRIATLVAERAAHMKATGLLPDLVTVEQIVIDARRELLDMGSLGPLLADDDVVEIHVDSTDRVLAYRKSRKSPTSEVPFARERSLARVLQKLSKDSRFAHAGTAGNIDVRTADGLHISTVASANAKGFVAVLRKPQRAEAASLDDLARNGCISRAMGTLLAHAVPGRTSVLIAGPVGAGHAALLSALVNASGADDRTIVLQDDDDLVVLNANAVTMALPTDADEAATMTKSAARMRPDRLVIGALSGLAASAVDAAGEGASSIIAATHAPTLRQALLRMTSDVMLARAGMTADAARECIANTFDLVIELARLRDGRSRVLRIAELRAEAGALVTKDLFVFAIDRASAGSAIEGSHLPTGTVPALVEDLAARGVTLDAQLFRRGAGK